MPCWREFNPVQWNWLLKITASSQTTSLDSFTPYSPSGCCRTPLQWSPTPSWAKQAILDAHSSPTVRTWGLHESFIWAWQKFYLQLPSCTLPSCSRSRMLASLWLPCQATHSMLPGPSFQLYRCCFWQNNPVPLCLIWFGFKSRYEVSHLKRKGQIQILPSLNITQPGSFTL